MFVAFGVYQHRVRFFGALTVTGGNAREEVAVFRFKAVLRGAALCQARAGGGGATVEYQREVGGVVGVACRFEGGNGRLRDAAPVVLIGVGGVAVTVGDVPFAAGEGGQDALLQVGSAGGEEQQQFA